MGPDCSASSDLRTGEIGSRLKNCICVHQRPVKTHQLAIVKGTSQSHAITSMVIQLLHAQSQALVIRDWMLLGAAILDLTIVEVTRTTVTGAAGIESRVRPAVVIYLNADLIE
eukprot:COSAG02_NODE_2008_length_10124_cov_83.805287_10_plen_113_part_00